jgi:hypothetical protein
MNGDIMTGITAGALPALIGDIMIGLTSDMPGGIKKGGKK